MKKLPNYLKPRFGHWGKKQKGKGKKEKAGFAILSIGQDTEDLFSLVLTRLDADFASSAGEATVCWRVVVMGCN